MKQSELKAILEDHKLWSASGDADLRDADLRDADLRGADLRDADLRGADLRDADLRGADLHGAILEGANLRAANLRGADLHDAYLQGAKFTTNLKKVRWFAHATFSEDQIPWVVLHPRYPEWARTLMWVKAEQLSA